jgi:hypothetical protein
MATLQERRLGYHSQAGLEPGTSRFSTLRLNHYAARKIGMKIVARTGAPPYPSTGLLSCSILALQP